MSPLTKQAIVAIPFFAVILALFAVGRNSTQTEGLSPEESLRRHGFVLREGAKDAGIAFVHQTPVLDPKLDHILPIIAAMGASVTVVDYDRDGLPDLYVVNGAIGSKNALYHNLGNGKFEEVADKMGVADLNQAGTGVCMGAIWGDFDNDGFEDLFIYKWGKPELFRNLGGKGFERVTETVHLPPWVNANSAVWLDFDGDGRLDLFIAGYWREEIDLWNLTTTEIMPDSFEFARNGGRKYLLRNLPDGTFEDVTEKMGIHSKRWTLAAAAADLCGSGYPDLVLANDYGVSEFYRNKNGKGFEEVGDKTGIGEKPKSGMNVSLGDIYNNGTFSLYVSNISEPGNLLQGNNLWVPQPQSGKGPPRYVNLASDLKVENGGWSWGARFGDLNNDGLLDLYLTNGYVSADRVKSYWYDYSKIAGSLDQLIKDAAKWPPIKNQSLSGYQQKCLWVSRRKGEFIDVAPAVGVRDSYDGRSVVFADLENRGVLDVVVANQKGPVLLYRNTVAPGRQWVQFDLTGTRSNRSAIGAQVTLHWTAKGANKSQKQVQVVSGGDGYASQGAHRLHFGLGETPRVEKAVIQWPSGTVQTVNAPEVGICHHVSEPKE